jgi:hypothetical protein
VPDYPATYAELVQQQRDYDTYMQAHWDTRSLGIEWQILAIIFAGVTIPILLTVAVTLLLVA